MNVTMLLLMFVLRVGGFVCVCAALRLEAEAEFVGIPLDVSGPSLYCGDVRMRVRVCAFCSL